MRVIDDGRGFDPASIGDRPGHLGLRGMHERAAAVNGVVSVASEPGRARRSSAGCRGSFPRERVGYAVIPITA